MQKSDGAITELQNSRTRKRGICAEAGNLGYLRPEKGGEREKEATEQERIVIEKSQ